MNRHLPLVFLIGLILTGSLVLPRLHDEGLRIHSESEALTSLPGSLEKRNTNAFARILGEIRIGAADYLFVKTELYLHGGIGYAPHTDELEEPDATLSEATDIADDHAEDSHAHEDAHEDLLRGDGDSFAAVAGIDSAPAPDHADEHQGHHEGEGVLTVIRDASNDFRGILGDLEREIQPWRSPDSPHVLTGGAELLPWFRLMTITNPHFVRGYRIGAMWLGRENKYAEALEFLQEGIDGNADNPELFLLYLSKVLMLMHQVRDNDSVAGTEALEAAKTGVALGLKVRPEDGETGKIHEGLLWTPDHAEDLLFLMRFESLLLERIGRFDEALAVVRRSLEYYPEDYPLQRLEERLKNGESPYQDASRAAAGSGSD